MQFSEEQKKAIEASQTNTNIYMSAGPGSGKSTTLAEIAKKLHTIKENKIILITFTNKSAKDILSKVGLEDSSRITGGTFHSTAFRLMKESGVKSSICDENKKRLIIKKIFDCRKDKDKFVEIYDKISRTKSMYPRPTCEITKKYNEELYKYDMMDFDDIIHNGIEFVRSGKSKVTATHILVDELQDTSGAQLELLKVLRTTTNAKILGVGDLDQCHPAGNNILTTNGSVPIEDLDSSIHKVPAYDGHGKVCGINKSHGYNITKTVRKYTGNIYKFKVNDNKFTVTPNHKMYVKWKKDSINTKYCIYIMERNGYYRLGQCKLFNTDGYFHLGIRSRLEEADKTWILNIYDTKQESLLYEQYYSIIYSIPTITFNANKNNTNFNQEFINALYDKLDSTRTELNIIALLTVFRKDINYPFWSKKEKYKKQTGLTYMIIPACNVFPEIMLMSEFKNKELIEHNIELIIEFANNINVYSLNVDKYHNYFCENILVSNSIYEWRGARPENVKEFIDHFGCKIYQLGLNFRSTQKIVEHSKKLISFNKNRIQKNLRAHNNERGNVQSIKCNDIQKEIDYVISYCKKNKDKEIAILYRTRLNKMKLEFELRKVGIKYNVNDSTDIVDRSAFRVLLGMLRMACKIYDIYDLDEVSKGMKALGKGAVEKVRVAQRNTKIAAHGEQIDLFEKTVTTFDDLIHNLYHSNKGMRKSLGNILKIQTKFKELKGESMNQLVRILPDYCTPSFEIPKDILTFLCDITEHYSLTTSNIRELCNDFGLDNKKEENNEEALVQLSTIHGFKGGERDIVIMPFCDWDFRPDDKVKNIWESERRLFYVAITRPKTKLILTYSGKIRPQFIKEMGL